MIFLGAGASKPFEIKTLEEMSGDLIKIMKNKGYGEIVEKITNGLRKFGMTPDFEAVYTIVEGLTKPRQTVKNNGPFTAYVCKELEKIKPKQNLMELPQVFRNFLYDECKFKSDHHNKIKEIYDKLFSICGQIGAVESRQVEGVEADKKPSVKVGYTIATTNYDMILESYLMMMGENYADGFRPTLERPLIKELDLTTYSYARQRWLIKLHGSIWQFRYRNSIFKTVEDPKVISSIPVRIEEQMMIYPTGEKPILHYPYYDFYHVFKTQKWNNLIAIGYSFRDDPVNIAILENLERVKGSKLIVVNPKPAKVIQNLGIPATSKFDERIIPVKGEFGFEDTFEKLKIALKVDNKPRYFARLPQHLKDNIS